MMKDSPDLIETRLATIERKNENLLEIRFKPDVKLDLHGIREVIEGRRRLCADGATDVLTVLPPDLDFDISLMTIDHYEGSGLERCTRSLAIAANSAANERFAGLYFAYFPQAFNTRVFADEADALHWLAQQAAARAGS